MKRRKIVWAGFNLVRTVLDGLAIATTNGFKPDFIQIMSGQDYPIKPLQDYYDFLTQNKDKSFIEYAPLPRKGYNYGMMDRINYYHIVFPKFRLAFPLISYLKLKMHGLSGKVPHTLQKIIKKLPSAPPLPRKFIKGYEPYEGSNWMTFSGDMASDLLKELAKSKNFLNYFKYTHVADEIFFQTFVINRVPNAKEKIVNSNLTYIAWNRNTGRPYDLKMEDWSQIEKSDRFFARKFHLEDSAMLMDKIDNHLLKVKS